MRGRMMEMPLLISSLIEHAGTVFGDQEVVTQTVEGPIHRYTWAGVRARSKQLAGALTARGIVEEDRIATLAWNTHRHLEIYYGVSGMGGVCHTLNPRLHPSQLVYIVNHAEDRILFVDLTFVPLVEAVADKLPTVETYVIMTDAEHMPETSLAGAVAYEDLLNEHDGDFTWPELDEHAAAALCYTSGTTGHPKGALYSHRSTVLHAYGVAVPDVFQLGQSEAVLPIVPLFHAAGWGLPYSCALTGTKMVFPGPRMDPESLNTLMSDEGVTCCAGVPSVILPLTNHWRTSGDRVPSLKRVLIGGAAPPRSLIAAVEQEFGLEFLHAWGMTETSPLGSVNRLTPSLREMSADDQSLFQTKQGRPPFGVELRIVSEEGAVQPHDGEAVGELQVRGPWVISGYYKDDDERLTHDGWFPTGDVASIDALSYVQITDRTKDLIKSGGEWISSIDLENAAMGHPEVAMAAVIGVPSEKWGERPLLIAVASPGSEPTKESLLDFLSDHVAKWQLPDDVIFVDELPMGATGKVQKIKLREQYSGG